MSRPFRFARVATLTIASWGGGKPVTLSYVQDVPFANGVASPTYILAPDPGSQPLYDGRRLAGSG